MKLLNIILTALLFLKINASNDARKWGEYIFEGNDIQVGYEFQNKSCSEKNCNEGGCRFHGCESNQQILSKQLHYDDGIGSKNMKQDEDIPTCNGGLCEFFHCKNPTCNGGACLFVNCTGAKCDGGGCHFVYPADVLKEHYCNGGGCRLNGRHIPHTFRNSLTY